ncbi:MAG: hypothetical protein HYR51_03370 [Candidatus Rokubacteria bacterium]|nr:hypothetical protein [Candidatus Rokubacteria bacterium]
MSRNGYRRESPAKSLQQAASTIFVLMALIPFLIFVWIAFALNALHDLRVQIGLALALGISLLGFAVLIVTMRRTATVLRLLVRADAARQMFPDAPTPAAGPGPLTERRAGGPVKAAASTRAPSVDIAPAIGSIRELREATEAVGRRWKEEAERLIGRAVRVSVVNFEQPEIGVISRVTDDGLILENAGQEFGVLWRFVSRIELYADPEAAGADTT